MWVSINSPVGRGPVASGDDGASSSSEQGSRSTAAVLVIGGGAALAAACLFTPAAINNGPELCPFRAMTGLPCPGCGLTRSWVALTHGDLSHAVALNWFGPVTLVLTVVAVVVGAWAWIRRTNAPLTRLRRVLAGPVGIVLILMWLTYGATRLLDAWQGWGIFPSVV